MKLSVRDVFSELREQDNLIAIYSELINHLSQFLSGDLEIPMEGSSDTVDLEYIKQISSALREDHDRLVAHKKSIMEWSVEIPEEGGNEG